MACQFIHTHTEMCMHTSKKIFEMIHRDAIHNSSKLETREITIRQINCGIYSHSGILYRNKNE